MDYLGDRPKWHRAYGAAKIPGKLEADQSEQPEGEQLEPASFYAKSALEPLTM
jgi:hypothetical protein